MSSVTVTKQLLTSMMYFNVGCAMNTKVVAEIAQDIATEIVSLVMAVMGVADERETKRASVLCIGGYNLGCIICCFG